MAEEITQHEDGSVTIHVPFTKETLVNLVGLGEEGITDQQWDDFRTKVNWLKFIESMFWTSSSWDQASRTFVELACPVKLYKRKAATCECDCKDHNKWSTHGAYGDVDAAQAEVARLRERGAANKMYEFWLHEEFRIVDTRTDDEIRIPALVTQ